MTAMTARPGHSHPWANGPLMAREDCRGMEKMTEATENRPLTCGNGVERVTGIEPALSAWEADVLPLNYTRAGAWLPRLRGNAALRCNHRDDIVPDPVGCQRAALRP